MGGDSNGWLVEQVAREMIVRHGRAAAAIAREFQTIAAEAGDDLSARAWRDIADAIERLQTP